MIPETLQSIISHGKHLGSFRAAPLVAEAARGNITGVASSQHGSTAMFLIFLEGSPAGAVYSDDNGVLYGDKAVLKILPDEEFRLFLVEEELVAPFVSGCRIHDATHLVRPLSTGVPEIGRRSATAGILTVLVVQQGNPKPGIHVSVRRGKQVIGSGVTTTDGTVVFRILPGEYECAAMDCSLRIVTKPVQLTDKTETRITLEIGSA